MKKLLLIFLIFLLPVSMAQEYFADVDIIVDSAGYVTIQGNTNHPSLDIENSPDLTSKKGKYWLLNITLEDRFSDFIFDLKLPNGAAINYLKTPRLARIDDSQGTIHIVGTGADQRFVVVAQYSMVPARKASLLPYAILGTVFLLGLAAFLYLKKKSPKKSYDLSLLTERQKTIFNEIKKNKAITQANLEKKLDIPKSSLSRNIDSLEKRGFIVKKPKGMCNLISLKK